MNLRTWKNRLRTMVDYPGEINGDADHPECPRCSATMDFYGHDENGDFPSGEGYWECPDCHFTITEADL